MKRPRAAGTRISGPKTAWASVAPTQTRIFGYLPQPGLRSRQRGRGSWAEEKIGIVGTTESVAELAAIPGSPRLS